MVGHASMKGTKEASGGHLEAQSLDSSLELIWELLVYRRSLPLDYYFLNS